MNGTHQTSPVALLATLWEGREWTELAVCAEADPETFFPEKGGSSGAAKRMCRRCPVAAECLDDALAHGDRHGIWGGVTERDRRRLSEPA